MVYSVGEAGANGGFQWSQPIAITSDNVQNTSPAIVVNSSGMALISYLKRGMGFQDDTDVYFSVVNVASGALVFNDLALNAASVNPKGVGPSSSSISFSYDWAKTI